MNNHHTFNDAALQGLTAQTIAEMMVTTLVNGYLAFEYITDKELRLQVFQQLCSGIKWGGGGGGYTRHMAAMAGGCGTACGWRLELILMTSPMGPCSVERASSQPQCKQWRRERQLCLHMHAASGCETRSTNLNMVWVENFWVFYPCSHPRQCYRQHRHHELAQ